MDPQKTQVTRLLGEIDRGDRGAVDRLLPFVYDDLRALARRAHRGPSARHSLQPTALVHEAYARLVGSHGQWRDRQHFLAVAAMAMRQILADYARRMRREKRGGRRERVDLTDSVLAEPAADAVDLVALHDALEQLAAQDPRQARIVELRFFAGLSVAEAIPAVAALARRDAVVRSRIVKATRFAALSDAHEQGCIGGESRSDAAAAAVRGSRRPQHHGQTSVRDDHQPDRVPHRRAHQ